MFLVIDANSFIAGFLRDSVSRKIILHENITLYSPKWLRDEFDRNERELKKKFPSSSKFSETKKILFEFINFISESEYSKFMDEASKLTKHVNDLPYFALALHLDCPIWSNEKSFKRQSKIKVYSTSELLRMFQV